MLVEVPIEVSQSDDEELKSLIREQTKNEPATDSQDQLEFNNLGKDHKLKRLNNLIQKSQVYSQIIAENILKSSLNRKTQPATQQLTPDDTPPRKRHKSRVASSGKQDIMTMLTSSQSSSTPENNQSHPTRQPKSICGVMKNYQLDGLHWLTTLYENGLNGILADEMGLGKTLQCISFLSFLIEQGIVGPFLIVVPLSTLSNWKNEFTKFAPSINVFKYSGTKSERQSIDLHKLTKKRKTNVIITSYEISIKDFSKFKSISWNYLIVDEGHRLKNSECVLIRFLKQLPVANRLLITGTPLQNNLSELWSLLNFILPDIFSDLQLFQQWFNFDELTNLEQESKSDDDAETRALIKLNIQENLIKNLHTILKPFILRRLKNDVVKDLPQKKEYLIHIPMTLLQKKLYNDAIHKRLFFGIIECYFKEFIQVNLKEYFLSKLDMMLVDKFLDEKFNPTTETLVERTKRNYKEAESDDEFEFESDKTEVTETALVSKTAESEIVTIISKRMRKGAKQKLLLPAIYSKVYKEVSHLSLQNMMMQLRNICNSPYTYYDPFSTENSDQELGFMDLLYNNSAKFHVLEQLCDELFKNNHKILIFSQFTKVLDLLEDWFEYKGVEVCRIDGSTSHPERDLEIKLFYHNSNKKVFLLSTRAGGLGINLVPADTVILFDNDWNPQMDLQAIDRVHRIGQTKPVKIFRFVVRNSIEEILIGKSSSKRFLEKLIIQMGEFKFNKLKKLIKADDEYEGTTMNVRELLELSKSMFKVGEENPNETNSNEIHDFKTSIVPEKLLTKQEMRELMDRSADCYNSKNEVDYQNITIFETTNNLDKK